MNFDNRAKTWDTNKKAKRANVIANEIKKTITLKKNQSVLEFGCGTGLVSFNLYNDFKTIDLIDSSKEMIKVVEGKIASGNIDNMKAIQKDITNGDTLKSNYDVIYTSMALHHIKNLEPLIAKFHKLLNEAGELCIVDLNKVSAVFHKAESDFDGHDGFEPSELETILAVHGFSDIRSHTFFEGTREIDGETIQYSLFILSARK